MAGCRTEITRQEAVRDQLEVGLQASLRLAERLLGKYTETSVGPITPVREDYSAMHRTLGTLLDRHHDACTTFVDGLSEKVFEYARALQGTCAALMALDSAGAMGGYNLQPPVITKACQLHTGALSLLKSTLEGFVGAASGK